VGATVSLAVAQAIFGAYPDIRFFKSTHENRMARVMTVAIAVVILAAIVAIYMKISI
jgi:hypothetical protein